MLPMLCVGSYGQEKYFEEALKRGREPGKFYLLVNEKSKSLKLDDLKEYADAKGYILGNNTSKTVSRFGDVSSTVSTLEFLPKSEFEEYIYYKMRSDNTVSLSQLSNKGMAYCYLKRSGKDTYFWRCNNIAWNGEVRNGKLHGTGVGYAKVSDGLIVYFRAKFDNGMPTGRNTFRWYFLNSSMRPYVSSQQTDCSVGVGQFSDGLASVEIDGKYGFINQEGNTVVKPQFNTVVSPFVNGRATVTDDKEEIVINNLGTKIDISDRQKQIYAEQKAEAERKALAEKKAAEERAEKKRKEEELARIEAIKAEKRRVEEIQNAMEGDRIAYSQDWQHSESDGFLFWRTTTRTNYKMKVICFVEKNVNNGERLQVRVASVESSDDRYYSTPIIEGIKYSKGDVLWIRPLKNNGWWME